MAAIKLPDENGNLFCPRCKENLPATEEFFYLEPRLKSGFSSRCRECTKTLKKESTAKVKTANPDAFRARSVVYKKTWQEKDPERVRLLERQAGLRKVYKMSLEDYDRLFEKQGGVCAICKNPPGNKPLAVDHDHNCCAGRSKTSNYIRTCGKCVRGLLCYPCNAGLGGLENYLKEAEEYLNQWNSN